MHLRSSKVRHFKPLENVHISNGLSPKPSVHLRQLRRVLAKEILRPSPVCQSAALSMPLGDYG